MFCIGDRALCFQSHPDFNSDLQQQWSEPEYYLEGLISEDFHNVSYEKCADTSMGLERRNLVLSLIREFIKQY
jgi:hypothetical protein